MLHRDLRTPDIVTESDRHEDAESQVTQFVTELGLTLQ